MLANNRLWAIIPVLDLERAKTFYRDMLGLNELPSTMTGYAQFEAGAGTRLALYQRPPSQAEHTLACFEVDVIEATMNEMRDKGITFEEYDMPGLKTDNGVATMDNEKAAWFKDSEGNILGLSQKG